MRQANAECISANGCGSAVSASQAFSSRGVNGHQLAGLCPHSGWCGAPSSHAAPASGMWQCSKCHRADKQPGPVVLFAAAEGRDAGLLEGRSRGSCCGAAALTSHQHSELSAHRSALPPGNTEQHCVRSWKRAVLQESGGFIYAKTTNKSAFPVQSGDKKSAASYWGAGKIFTARPGNGRFLSSCSSCGWLQHCSCS